ncbi:GNAT family N-acetyltransferase [Exiguobacterium sp. SH1S21]|uniref:GNAT family N-acetyltransferase n=1 Tax=unclassified Exiguobacterium TaxID=2644629 RepID=UPI00103A0390|nr:MULTISPECIES: GNAT family N-acetyltransferase [unclassified Exiguobacterium]TCI54114.1 GNAT family N-acetyltransferase [Exiguobacterium sp. SH1S21]TCI69788.1 GNAT family N-acetyltransferase [Exiguobacterium sp. SH0S7]
MKELRTELTLDTYRELVAAMQTQGYELYALYADDTIVSLAGIELRVNLYLGKHVFIYDLVTSATHRSNGYGERLLHFVNEYARDQGATCVALESGLARTEAHRFYTEKMGYTITSYSFRKQL